MYVGRILESKPLPMSQFDPMNVAKIARHHLESIREPRRRQVLENLIEHAEAEGSGNYDALMASCSKKKQEYATYGSDFPAPQSYAELEIHYRGLIDSNLFLIHFEVEKLVAGSDVVFLEGIVHQLYPGNLIEPLFGVKVANVDAVHQLTKRTALTFVFDEEGLGAGEHAYADGPTTLDDFVEVARDEVPAAFWERCEKPAG